MWRHQSQKRKTDDRLARPGFSDQPECLSGFNRESDPADGFNALLSDPERRAQIGDLEKRSIRHSRAFNVGSITSRMPSLNRLSPRSAIEMATPDSVSTQGARWKYSRPSAMIVPSDGLGGCTPSPMKLNPASMTIPKATPSANWTKSGAAIFGRISRQRMLNVDWPINWAAWTHGSSFTISAMLRERRANNGR